MRRRAERQMALAAEQARGRVHADPAGAGKIDLRPGVQIGEILVGPHRPLDRVDVGLQLDEIAGDEARGEAEPAQNLHQQPRRVAAGARTQRQRLVRLLHARLHADDVAHHALQFGVERDEKIDRAVAPPRDLAHVFREQRAGRFGRQIGGEFGLQLLGIGEREFLGVGLDEKVERIDDGEFGRQIDLDLELAGLLRKHEAREPVAVRILLPVDEMLGRRDLQRIAGHAGAAMRGRPKPDRLRPQRDRPVVGVLSEVMEADENCQGRVFRSRRGAGARAGCKLRAGTDWRRRPRKCQCGAEGVSLPFSLAPPPT